MYFDIYEILDWFNTKLTYKLLLYIWNYKINFYFTSILYCGSIQDFILKKVFPDLKKKFKHHWGNGFENALHALGGEHLQPSESREQYPAGRPGTLPVSFLQTLSLRSASLATPPTLIACAICWHPFPPGHPPSLHDGIDRRPCGWAELAPGTSLRACSEALRGSLTAQESLNGPLESQLQLNQRMNNGEGKVINNQSREVEGGKRVTGVWGSHPILTESLISVSPVSFFSLLGFWCLLSPKSLYIFGFLSCLESASPDFHIPQLSATSEHIEMWAWGSDRSHWQARASLFRKSFPVILRGHSLSLVSTENQWSAFLFFIFSSILHPIHWY